jgi:polysaccharide biosynthesis/export protein
MASRRVKLADAVHIGMALVLVALMASSAQAQASAAAQSTSQTSETAPTAVGVTLPDGYVIGPEDILFIVFWRDKDMSADVMVRSDGKISLPLLNDIEAAGSTPEQLRQRLTEAASKYIDEPNATVVVKEIRSRNVFITGSVAKPSTYPLIRPMNVLQLIALAGGLLEYADSKHITVVRTDGGQTKYHRFNYNEVVKQKNVQQNIALKPGDTVVVP